MKKIQIMRDKTLKLQNIISFEIDGSDETDSDLNLDVEIEKMNTLIIASGSRQIGPLIQFSSVKFTDNDYTNVKIVFMLQSSNFIHKVEPPYKMDSILRVKNCLYARYIGPEEKLKFAYDKLGVYAFENDIELEGCNYTIYVDRNEEDETMVADVFMPVKE